MQSPLSAVFRLLAFQRRMVTLTTEEFEECFDTVLDLLEKANNEKFRLVPEKEDE